MEVFYDYEDFFLRYNKLINTALPPKITLGNDVLSPVCGSLVTSVAKVSVFLTGISIDSGLSVSSPSNEIAPFAMIGEFSAFMITASTCPLTIWKFHGCSANSYPSGAFVSFSE